MTYFFYNGILWPIHFFNFNARNENNIWDKEPVPASLFLLSQIDLNDAEEFNAMHVVQNSRIWQRYSDEILSGVKIANDKFLSHLQKTGYGFSFDVDKVDKKFNQPTLILLGRQDSSVGYKDAWNILDNYPRATFAVLDRAGHNLQIEQEALFNCLVNEWLTRIEEA